MREITLNEIEGGVAIIAIGLAGGPATGAFGLLVGGACLIVGHYQNKAE